MTSNRASGDAWHMTTTGTRADPPLWSAIEYSAAINIGVQIRLFWRAAGWPQKLMSGAKRPSPADDQLIANREGRWAPA